MRLLTPILASPRRRISERADDGCTDPTLRNVIPAALLADYARFRSGSDLLPWCGEDLRHASSRYNTDGFSASELRRLAAITKNANQSRRLLSLAAVLDG